MTDEVVVSGAAEEAPVGDSKQPGSFSVFPQSGLGWLAVVFAIIGLLSFRLMPLLFFPLRGLMQDGATWAVTLMLSMRIIIPDLAAAFGIYVIAKKGERSLFNWAFTGLVTAYGLFITVFGIAEFLFPH